MCRIDEFSNIHANLFLCFFQSTKLRHPTEGRDSCLKMSKYYIIFVNSTIRRIPNSFSCEKPRTLEDPANFSKIYRNMRHSVAIIKWQSFKLVYTAKFLTVLLCFISRSSKLPWGPFSQQPFAHFFTTEFRKFRLMMKYIIGFNMAWTIGSKNKTVRMT